MIRFALIAAPLALALAACQGWTVSPLPLPPTALPTRTPRILSPTPVFITWTPSQTVIPTMTSTPGTVLPGVITPTEVTATPTPTLTPTVTPMPTDTPAASGLAVLITGCNTSVDISHGMGEVTNAYALIRNYGGRDLTEVCAELTASDEGRVHPDKTACIGSLQAGYEVTVKLTVDTGYRVDTSIRVDVVTDEGVTAFASEASCREIGLFKGDPDTLGTPTPIP